MIRAQVALGLALAFGALLAGCGSSHSQRPMVAGYIGALDKIEAAAAAPLASVTKAGKRFATEQGTGPPAPDARDRGELLTALGKLKALRAQAAAVPAPAPALRLRSLVLRLLDAQAALTGEVAQLIVFLPRFALALRPLGPAANRLSAVLSQSSANGTAAVAALYTAKANALRDFQGTLIGIYRRLRALSPPAVSEPEYASQLTAVVGMADSAGKLSVALGSGRPSGVQLLLAAFDRAAVSNRTVASQKAQIAAVRAYDRDVAHLATLSNAIQTERARLASKLK